MQGSKPKVKRSKGRRQQDARVRKWVFSTAIDFFGKKGSLSTEFVAPAQLAIETKQIQKEEKNMASTPPTRVILRIPPHLHKKYNLMTGF